MSNDQNLQSPGQRQVWRIAQAVLAAFPINPTTTQGEVEGDPGYPAYESLLDRLKKDPIVRKDRYTGQRIVKKDVANSYVHWLLNDAAGREVKGVGADQLVVDFNRIAFHGSSIGCAYKEPLDVRQRIYEGGSARAHGSTARAVLTLVQGDDLPTHGMKMSYLRNSRILVVGGGNHRAIAYKLLGLTNFPMEKVTVYDDDPHEELNQALRHLESLFTLRDPQDTCLSIVHPSDVDQALKLSAAFAAHSSGTRPSDLYCLTKRDLYHPKSSKTAGVNKTSLDLLELYTTVYQTLPSPQAQAWWHRFFPRRNTPQQPLPQYGAQEIRERWLARRASLEADHGLPAAASKGWMRWQTVGKEKN